MPVRRINPDKSHVVEQEINNNKKQKDENFREVFAPEIPKFSFDDIILPLSVKEKILDVAEYAKNSNLVFEKWGLNNTHKFSKRIGINLYGESGTGKTMAAHAIANYLQRKILIVSYADLESKFVGETPKNIRRVFDIGRETGSIIFFDEADAILSKRVTNMNNATDVSVNQTRSVMLMQMNEYEDFIIFATNFIKNFDPAFMRRISQHIEFQLPDEECRYKLWKLYIPESMPTDIDFEEISKKYDNITGSDISNAVLNAAFKAARRNDNIVSKEYIFTAVDDILRSKYVNSSSQDDHVVIKKVPESQVREDMGNDFVDNYPTS